MGTSPTTLARTRRRRPSSSAVGTARRGSSPPAPRAHGPLQARTERSNTDRDRGVRLQAAASGADRWKVADDTIAMVHQQAAPLGQGPGRDRVVARLGATLGGGGPREGGGPIEAPPPDLERVLAGFDRLPQRLELEPCRHGRGLEQRPAVHHRHHVPRFAHEERVRSAAPTNAWPASRARWRSCMAATPRVTKEPTQPP